MFTRDLALFMGQVLRRPHQVVAIAPSSSALCAEMVAGLDPSGGPVIELGAGTGNITKAILARGITPETLHCIEMNPDFCARLRDRFPQVHVHQMSAAAVATLPVEGVQAVISGLPLLSMPLDLQRDIVTDSFARLAPNGRYVQFTYGPNPPIARAVRDALQLGWQVSDNIWWNMPPARVYRFFLKNPTH